MPDGSNSLPSEPSGFQIESDAPSFYEAHVARFMAPFVGALVAAAVRRGDSVLDVACGTGFATRAAAAAAGEGARVEGSDLNPGMIALARTISADSGEPLRWSQASALDLPHDDRMFDAVICQQGLQFFPDPAAGLAEMARVTRPGGRVGVTVWAPAEQSPFLHHEFEMLARHGGAVSGWSATESDLRLWFDEGGVVDVAIERLEVEVDLPAVATYVPEHLKALPWSAGFFGLPALEQSAALERLDADLAGYRSDDGIRVPFTSYLAIARV